jgi:hypothetical protein
MTATCKGKTVLAACDAVKSLSNISTIKNAAQGFARNASTTASE